MDSSASSDTTTEAIMHATFRALGKHGYSEMTIANIADEFEKSKSLLYYHYEDKEELLSDFLAFLLSRIETELEEVDKTNPQARLDRVVDQLLPKDPDQEALVARRAILEVRAQAPHHPEFKRRFEQSDNLIITELTAAISDGINAGMYKDVDPEQAAETIYSLAHGIMSRTATLDDPAALAAGRSHIEAYIEQHLQAQQVNH